LTQKPLTKFSSVCILSILALLPVLSRNVRQMSESESESESARRTEDHIQEWSTWYQKHYLKGTFNQESHTYVVSYGFNSGTADRLSGMITIFFYALLTNRTFFIYEENINPKLEYAYDFPNVDIVIRDLESGVVSTMNTLINQRNMTSLMYETEMNRYYLINQVNYINESSHEGFYVFRDILGEQTNAFSPVIVASNRGLTLRMFENPFIQKKIKSFNLNPATAFRSFFDFLFKPNSDTWSLIEPYKDILSNDDLLKIGIAIRVGDSVFQGDENLIIQGNTSKFDHFYKCAQVC
jgi:hypothetical protein